MAISIALVGTPNSGKTTLFNNLTGSDQYVGNWPGVTVEKKEGFLKKNKDIKIVDIPGIYSLNPYSGEEVVTKDFLFSSQADIVLNIVNGINLERSLYLTLQLLEMGLFVVVGISMIDRVEKKGGFIDFANLSKKLGCLVFKISSNDFNNNLAVIEKAVEYFKSKKKEDYFVSYSSNFENYINRIGKLISSDCNEEEKELRFKAIRFLEKYYNNNLDSLNFDEDRKKNIKYVISRADDFFKEDIKSVLIKERYNYISKILPSCYKNTFKVFDVSDKIDYFLTHPIFSIPFFILIVGFTYCFCIGFIGQPVSNFFDYIFKFKLVPILQNAIEKANLAGWLSNLLVDGIFSGVGTVLTFIPQVFMLFLFLSFLEDCGYMARVAFILDRFFAKFGVVGNSVISYLVSSGCGVNGIMSAKTIKNSSSRFLTIITTTFIPCNAKLPIIAAVCTYILKGSFFPVLFVYIFCVASIFILLIVLKKIKFSDKLESNFIMELCPYSFPNFKNIFYYTFVNVKSFVVKAGSVIFIASILIWFFLNFGFKDGVLSTVSEENSFLALFGKKIAPLFNPIGFGGWQAVVATISGIFAKENVVTTFGVLLKSATSGGEGLDLVKVFGNNISAMAFLIFNLLCAPCVAAISAIYKQSYSFKLTLKVILIQTITAYIAALLINQLGGLIFGVVNFGFYSVVSFFILFFILFLICLPINRFHGGSKK